MASESRHTGWQIKEKPWLLHSCHWSKAITSQESGETVVIAETDDDHARLIAAAPTLYAYVSNQATAGDSEAARIMEAIHAGS